MAKVELINIHKRYGAKTIIHKLNVVVRDKEFLVLVGPSGCGKSTTIRLIAGLEKVTDGDILLDGSRINDIPAKNRDIAMVFQNYALYPHMNVYDNIAFALRLRGVPKDEIDRKVRKTASILNIQELLEKKPSQMSGGQKQRVALGRAIVREPKVFLMDEPLSNLDAKLRVQMRAELKKLHRELNATIIYVTHDQVEAMTMAGRMAVLKDGWLQQLDTPLNIYNHPSNMFVAGFVGSPSMNFIRVRLKKENGRWYAAGGWFTLPLLQKLREEYAGKDVMLGIRPEHIEHISCAGDFRSNLKGAGEEAKYQAISMNVTMIEPTGNTVLAHLERNGVSVVAAVSSKARIRAGEKTDFVLNTDQTRLFDIETQDSI